MQQRIEHVERGQADVIGTREECGFRVIREAIHRDVRSHLLEQRRHPMAIDFQQFVADPDPSGARCHSHYDRGAFHPRKRHRQHARRGVTPLCKCNGQLRLGVFAAQGGKVSAGGQMEAAVVRCARGRFKKGLLRHGRLGVALVTQIPGVHVTQDVDQQLRVCRCVATVGKGAGEKQCRPE